MGDIRIFEELFNLEPIRTVPKSEDLGYDNTLSLTCNVVDDTIQMCVGPTRSCSHGQWIRSTVYTDDVSECR